jgi:signal transduction histidine kinase
MISHRLVRQSEASGNRCIVVASGERLEYVELAGGQFRKGRILLSVGEDRSLVEEERKRLISVVSHELRTPLTAVDGYIDLGLDNWDTLDELDKREMIEIAKEQARRVTRIITELVETSRDSLHAAELKLEPVDVDELVEEVIAHLGAGSRIEVGHGSPSTVPADRGRLARVVTNLVTNALRYGGGRGVRCIIRTVGGQVELGIHDSGPGVPTRLRESIWAPFERGVHHFDAATPGSGLGLAMVNSLSRAHGGSVGYRTSELLGGVCFWVRIPLTGFFSLLAASLLHHPTEGRQMSSTYANTRSEPLGQR